MILYHNVTSITCHTHLRDFLLSMEGYHLNLTWMLTDIESFSLPMIYQGNGPFIISGAKLDELSLEFSDCQIIWGVLTGFRIPADKIDLDIQPISENPKIWDDHYTMQHPQAECELIAWDSSATFFRSTDQVAMNRFGKAFPESMSITDFQDSQKKLS